MRMKERIRSYLEEHGPQTFDELKRALSLSKSDRRHFARVLEQMAEEGSLHWQDDTIDVSGGYLLQGVYHATRHGYGFAHVEGEEEDYYVPAGETEGAIDGDRVVIQPILQKTNRHRARIIEVDRSDPISLAGTLIHRKDGWAFLPDRDLPHPAIVRESAVQDLDEHVKYAAKLVDFDRRKTVYLVNISEVIGPEQAPQIDMKSLVVDAGLPISFPPEVLEEADRVAAEPVVVEGREDYRELFTVTIDGRDAKDFDDAISIEKHVESGCYTLYVHIADVSHYVRPGSALEAEANRREMSIYLPGLVVPMLPQALSNGICSLNPQVERYAMTVRMSIQPGKTPVTLGIGRSVIRSDHRLCYEDVNDFYRGNRSALPEDEALHQFLENARGVHAILSEARRVRGAIRFRSNEAVIELGEDGIPVDIRAREEGESEDFIEVCMIAANVAVATMYRKKGLPFLYRVHEAPSPEAMEELSFRLRSYGLKITGSDGDFSHITAPMIARVLESVREKNYGEYISDMMLRAMTKAEYRTTPDGHFALALADYTHFTSPIRRNPDLSIHRVIGEDMDGMQTKKDRHLRSSLEEVALGASLRERKVQNLERDADQVKKCQFMASRIGTSYCGKVSAVTEFGIFVRLPNTVEGLISADSLSQYRFDADTTTATLYGMREKVRIGMPISVTLTGVHIERGEIDFSLSGVSAASKPLEKASEARGGKRRPRPKKGHKRRFVPGEKAGKNRRVRKKRG